MFQGCEIIIFSCLQPNLVSQPNLRIREVRPIPHKRLDATSVAVNCIQWWGSGSEVPANVEYPFVVITPRFTLPRSGSTIAESNRCI